MKTAYNKGRNGELLCSFWLGMMGYRTIASRYRSPAGEIDLVVDNGKVLAAVEVKARKTMAAAGDALSPRQQRRIEESMAAYLAEHPDQTHKDVRFDVMWCLPHRPPHHIANAWEINHVYF